ncbi:AMP-binding protein [Streptomyces tendae]|uniref:AMP-binding protein n=1 Tax=Streptomyces tendae TaxID=1932 RepID=A0A6B3QWF4_STRTE|nr:AMP-binding protein [Streptomyces tendae]NEV90551.1 AMP-binding protein [Streptomyces tendae]BET51967.1 class I adenylate-forming enzyme family protein [Kitasatospora aureofaciens]
MDSHIQRDGSRSEGGAPGELVHELLDAATAARPHATAVRDADGAWTYAELDAAAHAFGVWLERRGLEAGDRLVVQLPTSRELAAMFYGASRRGIVFVPLNPSMKAFHLRSVIANCRPALFLTDRDGDIRAGDITVPAEDGVPAARLARTLFEETWPDVAALCATGARATTVARRPEDPAALVYTSGSTADPKAVICPHAQVTFATRALVHALGYRPDDVVFCRFSMSWDYGLYKVLMSCAVGCEIVLADRGEDLLLLRRMSEVGATVVPTVPSLASMITKLGARAGAPLPPVRMFTNTGAALPAPTIAELRELFPGVRVVRQYGQTEAKRITVMPPDEDRERPDAVGLPLPGTRVLILDEEGRPLPTGQTGEIVAEGPHVMPGYWGAPELSARTFRPDPETGRPRLHTGDYGSLDADGYLYFHGRHDDMFKRKGFRMSTLEIEAAAMDIPGVRAAAAVPPGDRHDLALFVESELDPQVVVKELAVRLEPAKVPAVCRTLREFPLTLHGKNARQELARMLDGSNK